MTESTSAPETDPLGRSTEDRQPVPLRLEFAGEWHDIPAERSFIVGRERDLDIDDNPYLHRHFLELQHRHGLWWLANVAVRLAATDAGNQGFNSSALSISDAGGSAVAIALAGLGVATLGGGASAFWIVFVFAIALVVLSAIPGFRLGHAAEQP